jgi:hypothetical protein
LWFFLSVAEWSSLWRSKRLLAVLAARESEVVREREREISERSMPCLRLPLQAMRGMTVDIKNIYQNNLVSTLVCWVRIKANEGSQTTAASVAYSVY